jgi:hypothetical protein
MAVGGLFRSSLFSTLNKEFEVNSEAYRLDLNNPPTPVGGILEGPK